MKLTDFSKEVDQKGVRFLIASKYFSTDEILEFYQQGVRDFGENRIQEALKKIEALPKDIRWHFLGHLQSNKISKVKEKFCLIHSIDSLEIAQKCSKAFTQEQAILIQVKTTDEETKTGLNLEEFKRVYKELVKLPNLKVSGLMTLAPRGGDEVKARASFKMLKELKEQFGDKDWELSMGMSQDYPIAIEEGATLLRIGRLLKT